MRHSKLLSYRTNLNEAMSSIHVHVIWRRSKNLLWYLRIIINLSGFKISLGEFFLGILGVSMWVLSEEKGWERLSECAWHHSMSREPGKTKEMTNKQTNQSCCNSPFHCILPWTPGAWWTKHLKQWTKISLSFIFQLFI